jgi:hypothetical protein
MGDKPVRRGGRGVALDNLKKMAEYDPDEFVGYVTRNERQIARGHRNAPKYGLTRAEWVSLYEAQGRSCAICRKDRDLVIDHDHETGEVRGLLCSPCNTAIGLLSDSKSRLANAIVYLRRPPATWA